MPMFPDVDVGDLVSLLAQISYGPGIVVHVRALHSESGTLTSMTHMTHCVLWSTGQRLWHSKMFLRHFC